jgi:Cu/Ag efflux pump CusA
MIDNIIEFSGRNKFLVFILIGFAVVAGLWSMKT